MKRKSNKFYGLYLPNSASICNNWFYAAKIMKWNCMDDILLWDKINVRVFLHQRWVRVLLKLLFTFVSLNQFFWKMQCNMCKCNCNKKQTLKWSNIDLTQKNIEYSIRANEISILLCTKLFYKAKMKIMWFQCGLFELSLVSFDTVVLPT